MILRAILLICIISDFLLATWTWQEVRELVGWVRHIPQHSDIKIRHIVQYAPQVFLFCLCFESRFDRLFHRILIGIMTILSVGILSEVIQLFIPSRIFSFLDIFWNLIGCLLGGGLYYLFKK